MLCLMCSSPNTRIASIPRLPGIHTPCGCNVTGLATPLSPPTPASERPSSTKDPPKHSSRSSHINCCSRTATSLTSSSVSSSATGSSSYTPVWSSSSGLVSWFRRANSMVSVYLKLLLLLIFIPQQAWLSAAHAGNFTGMHNNVSQIIEELLDGYDIRLRPQFGGKALDIAMEIALASFDSISEVNMDYTITMYLNQYWKDERLAFSDNRTDSMTLTGDFAEKIWVPDTFFANDKHSFLHDVTEKNKRVLLYGDGRISYGMRFTTTLACMMDLHYYPLDVQNCTVEIESYGYPMQDVIMEWKGRVANESVHGVALVEIPQFTIKKYSTISTVEKLATGDYQRLSLSFKLQRNIGYFIFQTYLPSILIVMLSWVSFWINHEATSARVALGITTVLTMTTINTGVRSSLPRISYVKAIDIYLVMCFVFVFAALLEYAAVNYTYWGARAKRKAKRLKEQKRKQEEEEAEYQMEMQESSIGAGGPSAVTMAAAGRMSPILSLRSKSTFTPTDYDDNGVAMPTFRMQTTVPRATYPVMRGGHSQVLRRRHNAANLQKRKKVITSIKNKAREFRHKIPAVKDVNKIDKYARLVFPSLFIVFNICYWCFYLLQ